MLRLCKVAASVGAEAPQGGRRELVGKMKRLVAAVRVQQVEVAMLDSVVANMKGWGWPQDEARTVTRFAAHDAPVLREAGRAFRNREPQPGVVLVGLVQRLTRDETDTDGTVTLRTSIGGSNQSVVTVLPQSDYHRAIEAHKT